MAKILCKHMTFDRGHRVRNITVMLLMCFCFCVTFPTMQEAALYTSMNNGSGGLLQPTPLLAAHASNNNNSLLSGQGKQQPANAANVGTTWKNAGNINIDLDNLLGNGAKGGRGGSGGGAGGTNALSMNQLKSIHSSPVHQPMGALSPQSPYGAGGMAPTAINLMSPAQQQQQQPPAVGMMMGGIGGGAFLNGNSNNTSTPTGGASFGTFNAFQ